MAKTSRRIFVQISIGACGSLIAGCRTPRGKLLSSDPSVQDFENFNSWIWITPAGEVYFYLDRVEMGQGTMTSHAMMVCEELKLPPSSLRIQHAPPNPAFANDEFIIQITGGSSSVPESWDALREAAAGVRDTLITAARAIAGSKDGGEIRAEAEEAFVYIGQTKYAFGSCIQKIRSDGIRKVKRADPGPVSTYLGKSVPRVDVKTKIVGKAEFAIDVQLQNMVHCCILRSPYLRGDIPTDALPSDLVTELRGSHRLQQIIPLRRSPGKIVRGGFAIIAPTTWHCRQIAARLAAAISWPPGPVQLTEQTLKQEQRRLAEQEGARVASAGKPIDGGTRVTADYRLPHAQHQTMEPMTCVASYTPNSSGSKLLVVTGTQLPSGALEIASQISGLKHKEIEIKTAFLGGGFGRRICQDYVADTVAVAMQLQQPVKVTWTRTDDMRHDFFRPSYLHRVAGDVGAGGKLQNWRHKVVGASVFKGIARDFVNALAPNLAPNRLVQILGHKIENLVDLVPHKDYTCTEGASELPYKIEGGFECRFVYHDLEIPVGFWRSVGHSHTAFAVESFVDELAHAAGASAIGMRRVHLKGEIGERLRRCLDAVNRISDYARHESNTSSGVGYGIANHSCFGGYCAHVVRVSVQSKKLRIEKVWSAVDVGFVLNPDIARAQVESAVVYGLTAALKQQATLGKPGIIDQTNFHDSDLLRFHECPAIEVVFVNDKNSAVKPSGIGEIGVPPVAPALTNAIFRASGVRLRELPILKHSDLRL